MTSGSIGFDRGTSVNINRVAIRSSDGPALDIGPTRGHNPFEGGVRGPSGLGIGSVAAMLPIANPAPLLRYRFPVPDQPLARARLYITAAGRQVSRTRSRGEPPRSGSYGVAGSTITTTAAAWPRGLPRAGRHCTPQARVWLGPDPATHSSFR